MWECFIIIPRWQDVFTLEGNKLIQMEKWDGGEATMIHEITNDGQWTMVILSSHLILP